MQRTQSQEVPDGFSEPKVARIPVRSRRRAMDWSLVLVSQGIETTIDQPGANGDWSLLVAPEEMERALKALKQYQLENHSWPWRQPWHLPDVHFDWKCLLWAGAMIGFYRLAARNPDWTSAGIMDSAKVYSGQWWRLVTAMTLHADVAHLAENLAFGMVLFGFVIGRYGFGTGLWLAGLAGIIGNIFSLTLNVKPFHGLGASGMVMGALGLLSIAGAAPRADVKASVSEQLPRIQLGGVAVGVMLFALYGVSPGSDLFAHLGGFLGGLGLATLVAILPRGLVEHPFFNGLNGILAAGLLISGWWLAFKHGG